MKLKSSAVFYGGLFTKNYIFISYMIRDVYHIPSF